MGVPAPIFLRDDADCWSPPARRPLTPPRATSRHPAVRCTPRMWVSAPRPHLCDVTGIPIQLVAQRASVDASITDRPDVLCEVFVQRGAWPGVARAC